VIDKYMEIGKEYYSNAEDKKDEFRKASELLLR
jgi:hypothetical protein